MRCILAYYLNETSGSHVYNVMVERTLVNFIGWLCSCVAVVFKSTKKHRESGLLGFIIAMVASS